MADEETTSVFVEQTSHRMASPRGGEWRVCGRGAHVVHVDGRSLMAQSTVTSDLAMQRTQRSPPVSGELVPFTVARRIVCLANWQPSRLVGINRTLSEGAFHNIIPVLY